MWQGLGAVMLMLAMQTPPLPAWSLGAEREGSVLLLCLERTGSSQAPRCAPLVLPLVDPHWLETLATGPRTLLGRPASP